MLNETLSSFWNDYARLKFLENKENRQKIIGRDKSEHISTPIPKILGKR